MRRLLKNENRLLIEELSLISEIELAVQTLNHFNFVAEKHHLLPSDYIIWLALIVTCGATQERSDYHYIAASIADVARAAKLNRETVKRSLLKLEVNGLARRIQNRWIFVSIDEE